jgi:hypothetical protein
MPDRALRCAASAPLPQTADALAQQIIEQIEIGALGARADTRTFGAAIAERIATWFPSSAVAEAAMSAMCREAVAG